MLSCLAALLSLGGGVLLWWLKRAPAPTQGETDATHSATATAAELQAVVDAPHAAAAVDQRLLDGTE